MEVLIFTSYYIAIPLLVLTILVFVHEWGHFWVARRNNVRVDVFSVGFGPELFGWTDSLGTRWKFSMIPLGGYVKMLDDREGEIAEEEKKYFKLTADSSRTYPFAGQSSVTSLSFNFLDEAKIILACYNMDKEAKQNESFLTSVLKQKDSFRIDARSSAFVNYLKKKE